MMSRLHRPYLDERGEQMLLEVHRHAQPLVTEDGLVLAEHLMGELGLERFRTVEVLGGAHEVYGCRLTF